MKAGGLPFEGCPGSTDIKSPKPTFVKCPGCGGEVEIWTDEVKASCSCGAVVFREQTPSCIEWCPHAKDCVDIKKYEELVEAKGD